MTENGAVRHATRRLAVLAALSLVTGLLGPLHAEEAARGKGSDDSRGARQLTGLEVRLQGTVGILFDLGSRIEETQAYQDWELAGIGLEPEPVVGVNAELGWRLHPRVGAAVHIEHLVDYSVNLEKGARAGPRAGNAVLTGTSSALTGDVRLYALTETIQPYLVVGAGWMWVDTTDEPIVQTSSRDDPMLVPLDTNIGSRNGFVTRSGGVVDIYLSDSFFLTTEVTYVLPVGPVRDFNYVSIAWGFGYLF